MPSGIADGFMTPPTASSPAVKGCSSDPEGEADSASLRKVKPALPKHPPASGEVLLTPSSERILSSYERWIRRLDVEEALIGEVSVNWAVALGALVAFIAFIAFVWRFTRGQKDAGL